MPATILVVDDSATMRTLVGAALTEAGWRVVSACNGCDALEVAQSDAIDMVITDWNMPEMNGLALIQALRRLDRYFDVPIMVLTTETGDDSKQAAREAGASGWLAKPVDTDTLTDITAILLDE